MPRRGRDIAVHGLGAHDDQPLILTPTERADLVAFLEALTGGEHQDQ